MKVTEMSITVEGHSIEKMEHGTVLLLGLSPYLLGGVLPGNPPHNMWSLDPQYAHWSGEATLSIEVQEEQ